MTAPPKKMRFLVPTILWLLGSSPFWPLPAAGRFRRCETAASAAHAHDYDEYMIVIQGRYTLIINGERIPVKAGQEYFIPSGVHTVAKFLRSPERSTHLAATGPTASRTPNAPLSTSARPASLTGDYFRVARDTIRIIETPRYVPYWNGRSDGKSRPARGARSGGAAP